MIDGNWPWILGVCTLLGGASAIWFFWDKLSGLFKRTPPAETARQGGGAAVRGEGGSTVNIQNLDGGEMRGGLGGPGGGGGDAILVREGAGVTIINRGKIIGGDAGH